MALSVPLSRFTSRVGGGSAFFVRPQASLVAVLKNMKKRTTFLIVLTLFLLIAVALFIRGVFTPFTLPAPATWAQIYSGMMRSDIIAVVGAAQTSDYPKKKFETWHISGHVGTRMMCVIYGDGDKAAEVTEGIFWPFGRGYIETRSEQ